MPVLIPTYGTTGKWMMSLALRLNDLVGFDRNQLSDPGKRIPVSRAISRDECLRLCPGLDARDLSGGIIFYDCQVYNSERLALSFLLSASAMGADVANYLELTAFLTQGSRVTGIQVNDVLTGNRLEMRAKVVLNASGPWVSHLLSLLSGRGPTRGTFSKAAVLVTRPILQKIALGVPCRHTYRDADAVINKGYRYFFITPWRETSLVGTFHAPYEGHPDDFTLTEKDIREFIDDINTAYPAAALGREDVYFVYSGLLPTADAGRSKRDVQYAKRYTIHDHEAEHGIQGLVSVSGVKYTTARDVTAKAIDLVLRKVRSEPVKCRTDIVPLSGAAIDRFDEFVDQQLERARPEVGQTTLRHLIQTYGSEYTRILHYCGEDPEWAQPVTSESPVIKAEVLHAIREEMAQTLSDVIFRRTELGTAGHPGDACLSTCAALMAQELGWDARRTQKELEETRDVYASLGCGP
jgi:glycerol-3-phosphate dehydrogenase